MGVSQRETLHTCRLRSKILNAGNSLLFFLRNPRVISRFSNFEESKT